jgi:hypothetical protein
MNDLFKSDLVRGQWAISQNQCWNPGALQNAAASGCYGCQLYPPVCVERGAPRAYELVIELCRPDAIRLDYGPELRLLIADPIRGIDLREAIQKLKEALLKER